jgi:PAS domain S-box-containing protein
MTREDERDGLAAVFREVNQALVRADSRSELEAAVCETLTGWDPYQFAWIGTFDEAADEVRPQAAAGGGGGYLDDVTITVYDGETSGGPTGRAVRTGTLQVQQDIREDPDYEPWRAPATERGFAASAAVPLAHDGVTYGVLNVYADRAQAFEDLECELLEELGDTVGHALDGLAARAALESESRRYERLADRVTDGFYALDADWTVTYWNERVAERSGVPESEVVGERIWDVFPELAGMDVAREYRTAMETGEPRTFESYIPEPYDYWVEVDVYPDDEGMSVFSRNVTDRKVHERQLEALIENTVNPIYIKDIDGRYELMNEASADLFGMDRETAVGKTDAELFDSESAEAIREVDREIVETGRPDTGEAVRYVDGERHVFVDNKFPYRDATGDIVGVMGVSHEITERKAQQEELAETNQTLEAAITASPQAVIMVDPEERVTMWNSAAEDLFGWTREEVMGEPVPIVPEDKRAEFRTLVEQLDEGTPASGFESVRRTKDGDRVDVSISSARVDVDGEIVGYMATIEDISDRKAYQRRLEDENSRLEVLTRMVRHDIGNDLQAIQGYAELLVESAETEATRQDAEVVLSSADHALELTRTVRDLVETILDGSDGTTAVPLARVLDRELDSVSDEHEGVVVERATRVPPVTVKADDMLGSVFRNVLQNAARHADADPVRITVGVEEDDDTVTVRIADNGQGVPDDRKEAVFGKGERDLDSPGTGIGLYLVNVLVDGYGGDVWIADAEPTGAAVHVRLPRAE